MKWSRELKIARRSLRTVVRAASATMAAPLKVPPALPRMRDVVDFKVFATASRRPGTVGPEEATFSPNPGRLRMLVYAPANGVAPKSPLVVVLHGCGQSGTEFAEATGWLTLADQLGFSVIMPEQDGRNNQGRCFQWFQPGHTSRDGGEAASIAAMVKVGLERFDADPKRVFVVGLSAGGAMAASLLAAFPDVFAGGAVIAGLPVGAASTTTQALSRMAHPGPERTPEEWADQVKAAGPDGYKGAWPRISIWQGMDDTIVDPGNADLLATQWRTVHGVPDAPAAEETEQGCRHQTWKRAGAPVVEVWSVEGMPHAYPISSELGVPGRYIQDVHLSATRRIARFWGLGYH